MEITAIKQQVKLRSRYSIYIDGKYTFSLSDIALLASKLVTGQSLTEEDVSRYKQLSDNDKLYGRVLQFIAIRPRSKWELQQYFLRKKTDSLLAAEILSKLTDNAMIDDEAFARSWLESRRLLKPVSRRRLAQELRAKHIDQSIVEAVLKDDDTQDMDTLKQLIDKKRRLTRYQNADKLTQYLLRQGFNYDDVRNELRADD